ncbi:MogA/MoaB family molybdenum cofactor biosynthesis protein [Bythopirellula polymerisocia]|uniref:Molybdenum cofactor biosynthesis protein B n=1 Tax=Bythopirellula polymerisocia TaxID=2528003 RepID=A0A5C6D0I2_9BACT|nr:MogA/MoaB family molybdenum cofactor biosynthesis protein [Bythopirellula polymerisocia]TWU30228.1 Molybdenum cofactor biosynthesis protein B [Bythopirellula polymerisocia]
MTERYCSPSAAEHRQSAPSAVRCAVLTVSDTRTLANDTSGQLIGEGLQGAGHQVIERVLLPDEPTAIAECVAKLAARDDIEAVLVTGGTGIAERDQTPEAIGPLLTKELPGYGELLRALSYQEIGAAAMLSRACGGLIEGTLVLTMPGSSAAVRLAMDKLILPELGHLVKHARR